VIHPLNNVVAGGTQCKQILLLPVRLGKCANGRQFRSDLVFRQRIYSAAALPFFRLLRVYSEGFKRLSGIYIQLFRLGF